MPPNPPSKAHDFAMRSMSLRDMQISKSEKINSWRPPPAKSWGRPCVTANITQTPTQHGYKAQYPTVTALHTLNNTVAKGFNQMASPARTITVALDMSKAFDTVNTHTLI